MADEYISMDLLFNLHDPAATTVAVMAKAQQRRSACDDCRMDPLPRFFAARRVGITADGYSLLQALEKYNAVVI